MNKKLSFLITSKRNYENFAKKTVDSIYEIKTDIPFEIVICHPNEIKDDRITWIKDNEMKGPSNGFHLAYKKSQGEYVFICVDDAIIKGDIFGVIDFLNSKVFEFRKFKITTLAGIFPNGTTNKLTKFERTPTHPKFLNLSNNFINAPDFNVMCFPIASRETIENKLGGFIFHPRIKTCHDWWLGAFLAMNDEIGIQYNNAKLIGCSNKDEFLTDPIINRKASKYFGESYINTYRIIKNYKKGMPYVYDHEKDYLTEKQILNLNK